MSWLTNIARPEIQALQPYSHASWEPGLVRLHANECPWRAPNDTSEAGLKFKRISSTGSMARLLVMVGGTLASAALAARTAAR